MSRIFVLLERFAEWWSDGLSGVESQPVDDDAEREASDLERKRLAFTPWWL